MATKKISELRALTSGSILFGTSNRSSGDVFIPVVDGNETKKITIDELFGAFNIFSNNNLVFSGSAASTGSIGKLIVQRRSIEFRDDEAGASSFLSKTDIDNLKGGKSLTTGSVTQSKSRKKNDDTDENITLSNFLKVESFVNNADDNSYIKADTSKELEFVVNNTSSFKADGLRDKNEIGSKTTSSAGAITWNNFHYGNTTFVTKRGGGGQVKFERGFIGSSTNGLPISGSVNISGSSTDTFTVQTPLLITGSTETSGSNVITGSFDTSGSFNSDGSSSFSGSVEVSGSNVTSGSIEVTGSATFNCGNQGFGVNNLLDLLENFGNTGIPTGSDGFGNDLPGGGVGAGDINLDGQVNISDLLLLLSGYGNPATICSDITIAPNVNSQLVGPEITISSSVVVTVSDGGTLRVF